MKKARIIAMTAVVLIAALLSGCLSKTWSYDFSDPEADINDWYVENYGAYEFTVDGLSMSHVNITTPISFSGDMTVIVDFLLSVDVDNRARLEVGIEDDILWDGDNSLYADFWCLGDPESEGWEIEDYGNLTGYIDYERYEQVPGIRYDGSNTLKMVKTGNQFTMFMNGTKLRTITLEHFAGLSNYVTIFTGENGGDITIKNIEVKYSGDVTDGPVL